ncbi:guanine nucleotide-binding protein subunit beta-like protein 1 isoform X1 [Penaeus monodon]|uniref:guanine nucleotide-binding protein subunit beta-like protein 1 isoform X1 n=2 Tax=Penaeus monodon TaxID=6687 RepID=UPI0018A71E0D|nr:guanine nucleotide-binding protein subunit beta-like protein 1 isoform X1 [Penaeus monodon]
MERHSKANRIMTSPPDPVFVLRGANAPVTAVTFFEYDGTGKIQRVAAGTQEGQVFIWDLKTSSIVCKWSGHPGSSIVWIHSLVPGKLWTQGRHDSIKLWDITALPPEAESQYPIVDYLGFSQCSLTCLPNGNSLLAVPGPDQVGVTVWDTKTKYKICSLVPQDAKSRGSLMQVVWLNTAEHIQPLIAYESGHISLWDWSNTSLISETRVNDNPICLSFHNDSKTGIVGTASEKVFVFRIDNMSVTINKEIQITNPGVSSCITRPDGKIFALGGWDSRIRLFSSKKCKPLAVLQYHKKTVECLAYSKCDVDHYGFGYILAAGSSDHSISLWNIFNT